MDLRKLTFTLIGIICIISIIFAIYNQFSSDSSPKYNNNEVISKIDTDEVDEYNLINNFNTIFSNTIDYQNNNISNIIKKDFNKDLVYTSYKFIEHIPNKYTINAKIPVININNNNISAINSNIDSIFKNQISTIIANGKDYSNQVYDVEYMAYINSNILSLVIKANLKAENYAQRVLVKTYTYNLSTNEELKFEEILALKGVSNSYAKKKIKEAITKSNISSQALKDLGYSVYVRDLNSDIYNIENCSTFFIGKNGVLYVLYPYGNSNLTSEMDIIVF